MVSQLREHLTDATELYDLLMALAHGEPADEKEYEALRQRLMAEPLLKGRLPEFILKHATLDEVRRFIAAHRVPSQGRIHIKNELWHLIRALRTGAAAPAARTHAAHAPQPRDEAATEHEHHHEDEPELEPAAAAHAPASAAHTPAAYTSAAAARATAAVHEKPAPAYPQPAERPAAAEQPAPRAEALPRHEMTERPAPAAAPAAPAPAERHDTGEKSTTDRVREAWHKLVAGVHTDPDSTIKSARTLLKWAYGHVITRGGARYDESQDLVTMSRVAAELVKLSANPEIDRASKEALESCAAVIESMARTREKAAVYGRTTEASKVDPRQAELAANMAGAISTFLISTLEPPPAPQGRVYTRHG